MILKSLYLKNYRTYRGPEEVEFATGEKNVTIIKGNNEVGKTTIMNAITWCLYGIEFYKNEGNEPIWSKSTSYDLDNGEEDNVQVIITMEDSKGKEVKFIRELLFYKNDLGECRKDSEDSKILIDDVPTTYPSTYLRKHLPKEIREYFLFDGEQLESYFKVGNNDKIKSSVKQLSQLDVLERVKKHLRKCASDYTDELNELNPSLGRLKKQEQELIDSIESNQNSKDEIESNLTKWEGLIKEYSERIQRFGEDPSELIKQKNRLQNRLSDTDKKIESSKESHGKFLTKNMPKILSINALLDVREICADLEEKGYIPARFKKEFIEYLLEQHECICGADLSEGTPAHQKMAELYEATSTITNISDKVNLLLGSLNNIIDGFPKNFEKDLLKNINNIESLDSQRTEIDEEITDINNRLIGIDEGEVKELQEKILEYENLIRTNNRKLGKIDKQIEIDGKKLKKVEEEIIEEEKKAVVRLDIQSSLDLCQQALSDVKLIYNELENDIHNRLEDLTSHEFGSMHWKEFYEGVDIDKDFNVRIKKQEGYIVPNDLSKGGQLVLALSFMTALNSLSGFELPIVIDTPLGRLDEPIKENIGKYLPDYTRNKQVTLLVTGSEYSDAFRKGIRDHVGKEYELNYIQEKDGITTIKCKK